MSESETFRPERFIAAAGWQTATTVPEHPHQYTIRGKTIAGVEPPDVAEHDRMIEHIAEHGYQGRFQGRAYTYVDVDGHTYWASRGIYQPHPIINRRRNDGRPLTATF